MTKMLLTFREKKLSCVDISKGNIVTDVFISNLRAKFEV